MNPLKVFTTAEYLFRPRQILRRLSRSLTRTPLGFATIPMPWGVSVRVRPTEVIGSNIWYYGVFDLMVLETIARLLDRGETALDIGANIGQMTTLMSVRAGKTGRVIAFEAHPEIYAELEENLRRLPSRPDSAAVRALNVGLSNRRGTALLASGADWAQNRGLASIVNGPGDSASQGALEIQIDTIDNLLPEISTAELWKMDVEGHELQVLEGSSRLFSSHAVRDVVFEQLDPFPTQVHAFLLDHGYSLMVLRQTLWGPVLQPATSGVRFAENEPRNYLATQDPARAKARFSARGWKALRG